MRRTAITLVVVAIAAATVSRFVLSSPAERAARQDVDTVSSAIAGYVADTGRLPRITVVAGVGLGGDSIWGPDFRVESRTMRRADPSSARTFFLVGDAGNWCMEALYIPPSLFYDSSGEWVSAKGERGDVGKIVDGRCDGDYVLNLSPVEVLDLQKPGTVIDAPTAPIGTCLADPFTGDPGVRPARIEVVACSSAHFGEVIFTGEESSDQFDAYEDAAAAACASALMPFVGVPRNISAFTAEPLTVAESAWRNGAREFSCFLFLPTEDYPLVGSALDSWR